MKSNSYFKQAASLRSRPDVVMVSDYGPSAASRQPIAAQPRNSSFATSSVARPPPQHQINNAVPIDIRPQQSMQVQKKPLFTPSGVAGGHLNKEVLERVMERHQEEEKSEHSQQAQVVEPKAILCIQCKVFRCKECQITAPHQCGEQR